MQVAVVIGSMQANSQSLKVAKQVVTRLQAMGQQTFVVDLYRSPLPLWSSQLAEPHHQAIVILSQQLAACDAIVIVTPEYHSMVPANLKNFFLFFSGGELAHKPGFIISVSAGQGGANPIMELRTTSYKNSRINYIPEHLIIRNVNTVFNQINNDERAQQYLSKRLDYGLALLEQYASALNQVRRNLPKGDYPNGMS
ncbi:NADPH-dependent FMN reductase [Paraferrimonas sp. SM1919]|uniref:NADPH-dependent FMN reductase n=1 Tax=Paraferrimonas sp. SM1919 TaxID=2662263 RepID=UPI0013D4453C|nr:NAD(P)H-dependent oxidoreductase [Paraferrimonas sp. SM1919]